MKFDFSKITSFVWGELYHIKDEVELGIDVLSALIISQEKSLLETKAEFEQRIKTDSQLNEIEQEYVGSYYSQIYGPDKLFIKELQIQQRYAILLSLFSFFEARLKSVCVLVEEEFNFNIKLSDLKSDTDLMRYWIYLDKVFATKLLHMEATFKTINLHKRIRNKIAHRNALINENEKNGFANIQGIQLNKIVERYQIEIVDPKYLENVISLMKDFFTELLVAVDLRYKEVKKL